MGGDFFYVFCMLNISLWLFGFFVLNLFSFLLKQTNFFLLLPSQNESLTKQ
jgi:hypothetical protein